MIPLGPLRLLPQVRAAEKDNTQFKTFIDLFKLFRNNPVNVIPRVETDSLTTPTETTLNSPLVFSPGINAHEIIMKGDMAL